MVTDSNASSVGIRSVESTFVADYSYASFRQLQLRQLTSGPQLESNPSILEC